MNESNLKAHLESCRERVQNQNTVNLFFSTIALSITTLSLTLFGIGASLANEDAREVVLVGILGGCLLVVSVTCLGFTIRPRNWFLPCDLEESEELAFTSEAKEEFLVSLLGPIGKQQSITRWCYGERRPDSPLLLFLC